MPCLTSDLEQSAPRGCLLASMLFGPHQFLLPEVSKQLHGQLTTSSWTETISCFGRDL